MLTALSTFPLLLSALLGCRTWAGDGCPEGMSAVTRGEELAFCIDTWEASVEGPAGETSVARSLPEVQPVSGVSFLLARKICANTPVLRDGQVVGHKYLPSSAQWTDAADGQVGSGGAPWVSGKAFDPDLCVTSGGDLRWEGIRPTGSMPACKSPFGAVDMMGNVWEWSDPQLKVDIEAWRKAWRGPAYMLTEDGALHFFQPPNPGALALEVAGAMGGPMEHGPQGLLVQLREESWDWERGNPRGYLLNREIDRGRVEAWLPVEVEPLGDLPGPGRVKLLTEADGSEMADKRGCAWYGATELACNNGRSNLGHTPDFQGTIGFRCAWTP